MDIHNISSFVCKISFPQLATRNTTSSRLGSLLSVSPEVRLPNRKIGQSKGKTTILECVVTAYPHAITVWRRNGKDIERNSKYNIEVRKLIHSIASYKPFTVFWNWPDDDDNDDDCFYVALFSALEQAHCARM